MADENVAFSAVYTRTNGLRLAEIHRVDTAKVRAQGLDRVVLRCIKLGN